MQKIKELLGLCNHSWAFRCCGMEEIYYFTLDDGFYYCRPYAKIYCKECGKEKIIKGKEIKLEGFYYDGENLSNEDNRRFKLRLELLQRKVTKKYNIVF